MIARDLFNKCIVIGSLFICQACSEPENTNDLTRLRMEVLRLRYAEKSEQPIDSVIKQVESAPEPKSLNDVVIRILCLEDLAVILEARGLSSKQMADEAKRLCRKIDDRLSSSERYWIKVLRNNHVVDDLLEEDQNANVALQVNSGAGVRQVRQQANSLVKTGKFDAAETLLSGLLKQMDNSVRIEAQLKPVVSKRSPDTSITSEVDMIDLDRYCLVLDDLASLKNAQALHHDFSELSQRVLRIRKSYLWDHHPFVQKGYKSACDAAIQEKNPVLLKRTLDEWETTKPEIMRDLLVRQAQYLELTGQYSKMKTVLAPFLSELKNGKLPTDPMTRQLLVVCLSNDNADPESTRLLASLLPFLPAEQKKYAVSSIISRSIQLCENLETDRAKNLLAMVANHFGNEPSQERKSYNEVLNLIAGRELRLEQRQKAERLESLNQKVESAYFSLQKHDSVLATKLYKEALAMVTQTPSLIRQKSIILNGLAGCAIQEKDFDAALKFSKEALRSLDNTKDETLAEKCASRFNIGFCYFAQKRYLETQYWFELANKDYAILGATEQAKVCQFWLADAYLNTGNFSESKRYLNSVIALEKDKPTQISVEARKKLQQIETKKPSIAPGDGREQSHRKANL